MTWWLCMSMGPWPFLQAAFGHLMNFIVSWWRPWIVSNEASNARIRSPSELEPFRKIARLRSVSIKDQFVNVSRCQDMKSALRATWYTPNLHRKVLIWDDSSKCKYFFDCSEWFYSYVYIIYIWIYDLWLTRYVVLEFLVYLYFVSVTFKQWSTLNALGVWRTSFFRYNAWFDL